jgi:hypothetical protein
MTVTREVFMSAPLRIRLSTTKSVSGDQEAFKPYLDRLLKLIPAEVLSLYAVGTGFIEDTNLAASSGWALFCLLGTGGVKAFGTADRRHDLPPDWTHVALSMAAFVTWVYYLGGPFVMLNWHSKSTASLLILAFTFVSPYFYRGSARG